MRKRIGLVLLVVATTAGWSVGHYVTGPAPEEFPSAAIASLHESGYVKTDTGVWRDPHAWEGMADVTVRLGNDGNRVIVDNASTVVGGTEFWCMPHNGQLRTAEDGLAEVLFSAAEWSATIPEGTSQVAVSGATCYKSYQKS